MIPAKGHLCKSKSLGLMRLSFKKGAEQIAGNLVGILVYNSGKSLLCGVQGRFTPTSFSEKLMSGVMCGNIKYTILL